MLLSYYFRQTVKYKEIKCSEAEMESVKNIINLFSFLGLECYFWKMFHDFYAFSLVAIISEMPILFSYCIFIGYITIWTFLRE